MTGSSAGEATLAAGEERWQRLPPWLRPRTVELKGGGNLRLIETTLLVLVGVVLATATVNDVGREVGINRRLIADLKTWRQYTGHDYTTSRSTRKPWARAATARCSAATPAPARRKAARRSAWRSGGRW